MVILSFIIILLFLEVLSSFFAVTDVFLIIKWQHNTLMGRMLANFNTSCYTMVLQMAFELYGMLAGNVSPMTGENVKPAYGGEEDAFLRKVVTPIYEVIAMVWLKFFICSQIFLACQHFHFYSNHSQEAQRSKKGKSKHSQWRNYDDLNEYFW